MRTVFYHPLLHPSPLHVALFGGYNYAPTEPAFLREETISQIAGMIRDYEAENGKGSALALIQDAVEDSSFVGSAHNTDYPVLLATFLYDSMPVQNLLQDTRQGYRKVPISEIRASLHTEDIDARLSDFPPSAPESADAYDARVMPESKTISIAEVSYILGHANLKTICESLNRYLTETV